MSNGNSTTVVWMHDGVLHGAIWCDGADPATSPADDSREGVESQSAVRIVCTGKTLTCG